VPNLLAPGDPGRGRNLAHTHLGGVHEVAVALHVHHPTLGVVGNRGATRRHVAVRLAGEQLQVGAGRAPQRPSGLGQHLRGGWRAALYLGLCPGVVSGQRLQGKRTKVIGPALARGSEEHGLPRGRAAGGRSRHHDDEARKLRQSLRSVE
jgi:hypothetical protein